MKKIEFHGNEIFIQQEKLNEFLLKDRVLKENQSNSYFKAPKGLNKNSRESFEEAPMLVAITSYLGFYLLMIISYVSQIIIKPKVITEKHRDGYVPLYDPFEKFYLHYVFRRLKDCVNRPICSVPSDTLVLKDRISEDNNWSFKFTGTEMKCINLGSYNYLGFAQNIGPCAEDSAKALEKYGVSTCSPRRELGTNPLHKELETLTAQFLGVDDAIIFGMGFATNALNIPCLLSPGCLVVSDEKNHASIVLGVKLSGATVKIYMHNNMASLEEVIRNSITEGQPNNGVPWKKILIMCEGVFSLEGSIAKLPEIVAIKKKYKTYLYLDEAHSVGAIGPRGRGVTDYYGIDPNDIDILMGTFTKSFGSAGGYIAGSKNLINYLRVNSHATCYASSISPAVTQQVISSMRIIMGLDGTIDGRKRIEQLSRNTRFFRRRLAQIGVITYGHEDSPVVPMLGYHNSKCMSFSRRLKKIGIAVVGAAFPAVPITKTRIRFCLSAAHTKEQLSFVLSEIDDIADSLGLKYSSKPRSSNVIKY